MNHHYIATPLLIAGLLLTAPARIFAAPGPAVKTVAAKPKLAPRPLPGTSGKAAAVAPAATQRMTTTVKRIAQRTPASAAADNAGPEARILMIYRNGTAGIPAVPTTPDTGSATRQPDMIQPSSLTNPRPGQVRIISKAEADALAAQPQP
jgi:hypothetical protein